LMVGTFLGIGFVFTSELMVAFAVLLDGYIGWDQFAAVQRTKKIESGRRFDGNRTKLIHIVWGIYGLFLLGLILDMVAAKKGQVIELPVVALLIMFVLGATALTGGEKIKTAHETDGPPATANGAA